MVFSRWHKEDPLIANRLGILEPGQQAEELKADSQTLICVPAVLCDREGARIGYGGGFYDRFFERHRNMTTVGIVFDDFLVSKLPTEAWDRPVDYVCTDLSLITCSEATGLVETHTARIEELSQSGKSLANVGFSPSNPDSLSPQEARELDKECKEPSHFVSFQPVSNRFPVFR